MRARAYPDPRPRPRIRTTRHVSMLGALFVIVASIGINPIAAGPTQGPVLRVQSFALPGLASTAPLEFMGELSAGPVPLTILAPRVTTEELLAARDMTGDVLAERARAAEEGSVETTVVSSQLPARMPRYYEYPVQPGDTLTSIAANFGVSVQSILDNNVDLIDDANDLNPGDSLFIPSMDGILHNVSHGDTLSDIADRFDADVRDIIGFAANEITNPDDLPDGKLILIPGGRRPPPPPAPSLAPAPEPPAEAPAIAPGGDTAPAPPSNTGSGGWMWPTNSRNITNFYGPTHPLGIDVAMPRGSAIYASAAGTVVWVGGDACCSYGLYIDVDHGNGYLTRYAHLDGFNVSHGQWVNQGDIVGSSGSTGRSTGPHLHFEIIRNGANLNPLALID